MAAKDIVPSLFGLTPEMYQEGRQAQIDAQAFQYAQLDPFQKASFAVGRGGNMLGGAIGLGLGGQDPGLQRITQQAQLMQGLDLRNPQSLQEAAIKANQMGNSPLAFKLFDLADAATVRAQQAETLRQTQLAQLIARSAYQPGTAEQTIPERAVVDEAADTSYLEPERIVPAVAPSYDISRVAPQLQLLGAPGFAQLKAAGEAAAVSRPEYKVVNDVLYEIPKFGAGGPKAVTQAARKTISIGNRVLDANTMEVLFTAPDPTPAAVAEWKAFQELPKNEQQSFLQLQAAKRPSTNFNMPREGEVKAAVLANRLNFSVDQINQAIGMDPTAAMPNTSVEIARFLTRSEMLSNKLTSAQRQIVETAQLDILDAALTLGTGAAYTREQLESYRKAYFPQLGDKPEVVVAKRARLQNILRSAEIASGRAKVPTPIPSSGADLSSIINAPPSN